MLLWLIEYLITSAKEVMLLSLFVCLVATLCRNFRTDLHEIFSEGWQRPDERTIKFWWRSRSRIRIRIRRDPDTDPYRDTGKTCLGRDMHYPSASSLKCNIAHFFNH